MIIYDYELKYNNNNKCYQLCKIPRYIQDTGKRGKKGPQGDTGPQGPQGDTGPQGIPGSNSNTSYTISIILDTNFSIDTTNDYDIYQIDTSNNTITITLPEISTLTDGKRIYNIVDVGENLINNNCIINVSGSDSIQGQTSYTMNINYSNVKLCSNTIDKWLIL